MSGKSSAKILPESRHSSSWQSDPSGPQQPQSKFEQAAIGGNNSTSSFENSFLILSLFTRAVTMNLCRNGRTNMFVTLQGTSNFKAFKNNKMQVFVSDLMPAEVVIQVECNSVYSFENLV